MKMLDNPVDTGRKLNVHKTFRRRPGRLLNVLCTFNLCPVSTENAIILTAIQQPYLWAIVKLSAEKRVNVN